MSRFSLSHQHRNAAYLACLAVMILVLGYAARPAARNTKPAAPEATISQSEIERLREQVRESSYQQLAKQFARVANSASESFVWAAGLQRTAIVWSSANTLLVTRDPDSLPRSATVAGQTGPLALAPTTWVPGLPFAVMTANSQEPLGAVAQKASELPAQGGWVVLVSRRSDGHVVYTSGTFSGAIGSTCTGVPYQQLQTNIPVRPDLAGSGLFDMQGRLLGVVVPCGELGGILAIDDISRALDASKAPDLQVLAHYGMRLDRLSPQIAAYFGRTDGALVAEVWDDWPGARAGILPGDIVVSVDDGAVAAEQPMLPLNPGAPVRVAVRRGLRSITVTLDPRPETIQTEQQAGIVVDDRATGVPVRRVLSGTPEARAGVQRADEVVALVTAKEHRRITAPKQLPVGYPAFIVVRRGSRLLGLMVTA